MILRLGRRKLLSVSLGMIAAACAFTAWLLWGTDALLGVVLAAVVLGTVSVVNTTIRAERRLRLSMNPALNALAGQLRQDLNASMAHIEQALVLQFDRKFEDLDRKLQRPGEQAEANLRAIKAGYVRLQLDQERRLKTLHESLARSVDRVHQTMNRQFKHSPAEIDAMLQIHRRLELEDPLPLMGGWALSPRGLLQAVDLVEQRDVSLVVECGSGTSTLFVARALQMKGSGRLIALEHSEMYKDQTEMAIRQHGLSEVAEVRHAPLEEFEIDSHGYMWFAASTLGDLRDIDLLIVDGPPGGTGTWARYPAYPLLRDGLAPGAMIFVDDAARSDEKAMVDAWLHAGQLTQLPSLSNDQAILRFE